MAAREPERPSPDEEHNRGVDRAEHGTAQQVGAEHARASSPDPRELLSEEFIDTVTGADVARDLPDDHPAQHNVEDKLGGELSKQLALGQISKEEWEKQVLLDNARRHLLLMHYRRPGGTGDRCVEEVRRRYTGEAGGDKPRLTDDLETQIDAGYEAKKSLRSGAINGRTMRMVGEAHVVTRSEGFKRESGSSGGLLSKVTGGLLGS